MIDIPGYDKFIKIETINKGWSDNKKYYIETIDGDKLLLRKADLTEYARMKAEYEMLQKVADLYIKTPQPINFGYCDGGKKIYQLLSWIDGEDAETVLPSLTKTEQYELGLKSGKLLKKIHSISAAIEIEDWSIRFEQKVNKWIELYYSKTEIQSELGEMIVKYLIENHGAVSNRTQTFIHGDYNTENLIVMPDGEIGVIDFNSYNSSYGDPWWDINNTAWMPNFYPNFYSGQLFGYFNNEPPLSYWNTSNYYLAYDALTALTDPMGLNGIEDGMYVVHKIMHWTDSFKNIKPNWYIKK